ncbi:NUDIX domain-containing protein [Flexibacter flexilis]|uniref:NUDIX domain-containing protein n=1 Tax=Flexibacter flexilis TaxID=998 RepID=UPI001C87A47E|nr:NUDIX hydrolase [Flexibacter flexilis]
MYSAELFMSYCYEYPRPMVCVDALIIRKLSENLQAEVLLIQRKKEPYKGTWACPGGFLEMEETLEEGAVRELREETGLEGIELTQFHAFGDLHRDPRGRNISIAFYGFATVQHQPQAADDAANAAWFAVNQLPILATDHDNIIEKGLKAAGIEGFYYER